MEGKGVCPCARGCWWSSGTMTWTKIPIHPQWTQANTFLETILSARVVTLSPSPDEQRSLWKLKCSGAGHRQKGPWGAVPVLQSRSWSSLWCTGSLPGWHTSSAGTSPAGSLHMGTFCMDPGMWLHPRQAPRTSIQSVPRRHRCRIPVPVTLRWAQWRMGV